MGKMSIILLKWGLVAWKKYLKFAMYQIFHIGDDKKV